MFNPDGPFDLRGHHVSNIGAYYFIWHIHNPNVKAVAPKGYRESFNLSRVGKRPLLGQEVYRAVILNQNLEIRLTDTLDVICLGDKDHLQCLQRKPEYECELNPNNVDRYCLEEYGLSGGQIVTSGEIMKRIVEYKERTGFVSPRERCES